MIVFSFVLKYPLVPQGGTKGYFCACNNLCKKFISNKLI